MSKLLRPFHVYYAHLHCMVALATHRHLKINFKPVTVVTVSGVGLFLLINTTFLSYKQLSTALRYNNYIKPGLNNLDFRPQGSSNLVTRWPCVVA